MAESFEHRIRGVMSGENRSVGALLLRGMLSILSFFYLIAVTIRYKLFDWGIRKPKRLPVPVISVGNLTTGGTGKTPVVAWMVEALCSQSLAPAILMRGYTKGQLSDECRLYQSRFEKFPGVHVMASPRRYETGLGAMQLPSPPDVFVLDDGFQHRQLHRDLDIVLIDATNPLGYDHLLPRGMLRESKAGLCRADAIVITRTDQVSQEKLEGLVAEIRAIAPLPPVLQCTSALTSVETLQGTERISTMRGRKVFAFCGIGNPRSFQVLLERVGANVVALQAFEDHQEYSQPLIASLIQQAKCAGAEMLVTTEKDWMKVMPLAVGTEIPICSVKMQLQFSDGDTARLLELIATTIQRK